MCRCSEPDDTLPRPWKFRAVRLSNPPASRGRVSLKHTGLFFSSADFRSLPRCPSMTARPHSRCYSSAPFHSSHREEEQYCGPQPALGRCRSDAINTHVRARPTRGQKGGERTQSPSPSSGFFPLDHCSFRTKQRRPVMIYLEILPSRGPAAGCRRKVSVCYFDSGRMTESIT